jgi:DNA modification methylase
MDTGPMEEYDSAKDAHDSYYAAVEAKRLAGLAAIRREVQIGDCRLILGDCREILPALGMVNAIVTDPPYGINANKQTLGSGKKVFERGGNWDKERPDVAWIPQFAKWFCIWGGNYFADVLPPTNHILVWHKLNDGLSFSECEFAWTNAGKQARIIQHHWSGEEKQHPTQKPLEVMKKCLAFFPDAHTILDPFMGSGTTGVACVKAGRKFIGIEIDEGYFDIACERIRKAYAQPDMFIETARVPEPTQEALSL